jgi:hypothetical protein
MKPFLLIPLAVAAAAGCSLTLTGCEDDTRDSEVEEVAEDIGEGADQAAQSIEYEAEEAGLATPDPDDDTGPEDDL